MTTRKVIQIATNVVGQTLIVTALDSEGKIWVRRVCHTFEISAAAWQKVKSLPQKKKPRVA